MYSISYNGLMGRGLRYAVTKQNEKLRDAAGISYTLISDVGSTSGAKSVLTVYFGIVNSHGTAKQNENIFTGAYVHAVCGKQKCIYKLQNKFCLWFIQVFLWLLSFT